MRVLYLNNDGGGFADYVEIPEGTTVAAFFEKRLSGRQASDFLIRVNRQPAAADQVLCDGDRVSITPTKIEGAARCGARCPRKLFRAAAARPGRRLRRLVH